MLTHRMILPRFPRLLAVSFALLAGVLAFAPAQAADRDQIGAFLNVTGFDVALDSITLSASSAPVMLGLPEDNFGADWQRLANEVFDTKVMRDIAEEILEATLSDEALAHAAEFYASDLGQRLVAVENASHMMEDRDDKSLKGQEIVADLLESAAPRLEVIKRMNKAVNSSESSVKALQEIQVRFLLAANAAGVIQLKIDEKSLRKMMKRQEGEVRRSLQQSALAWSALTYQDFSDTDIEAYTEALEHPQMREVYELLNAVQHEIMANRFEVLATRMADLHPSQDI